MKWLDAYPDRVGGVLCLDFTNTAEERTGSNWSEYLGDFSRLVTWEAGVDAMTGEEAAALLEEAERRPGAAASVYGRAIELREALYRAFSAIARGEEPAAQNLATVGQAYVDALGRARLTRDDDHDRYAWLPAPGAPDLDRALWPLSCSAVELLTSDVIGRVKECPGGGESPCSWLFVDSSKNATRRWCRMDGGCGTIAKARRQTARRRASRGVVQLFADSER